jgi:hypothetical protein
MGLKTQAIARSLSQHDGFVWMRGMSMCMDTPGRLGHLKVVHVCTGGFLDARPFANEGCIPDLCDPATVGALAYLVKMIMQRRVQDPDAEFERLMQTKHCNKLYRHAVVHGVDVSTTIETEYKHDGETLALYVLQLPQYGEMKVFWSDSDKFDVYTIFDKTIADAANQVDAQQDDLYLVPSWKVLYCQYSCIEDVPEALKKYAYPDDDDDNDDDSEPAYRVDMTACEWAAITEHPEYWED